MANSYTLSCSLLKLTPDQQLKAKDIVDRVVGEMEENDFDDWGFLGVDVSWEAEGMVLQHDESIVMGHAVQLVRAVIEELEIDESFIAGWSGHCDKSRIDEFYGGAVLVKRGYETVWLNPMSQLEEMARTGVGLTPLEHKESCTDS